MAKNVQLPDGRVIAFPDGMSDKDIDAKLRLSLAMEQGTNNARASAEQRSAIGDSNQRAALPDEKSSFSDVMAWKERAMEPGGSVAPQTPSEKKAAATGAGIGLTAAGTAAGVSMLPPAMLGLMKSMGLYEGTKYAAKKAGAPTYVAEGLGVLAGGGSALKDVAVRGLAKKGLAVAGKDALAPIVDAVSEGMGKNAARAAASKVAEERAATAATEAAKKVVADELARRAAAGEADLLSKGVRTASGRYLETAAGATDDALAKTILQGGESAAPAAAETVTASVPWKPPVGDAAWAKLGGSKAQRAFLDATGATKEDAIAQLRDKFMYAGVEPPEDLLAQLVLKATLK